MAHPLVLGGSARCNAKYISTCIPTPLATMSPLILILEDQPDGIALLIAAVQACFDSPQIRLAINLASARELVASQSAAEYFDYALVDLRLPDGMSLEWIAEFKAKSPRTQIIVTSLYDDDDFVYASLRGGADGYVLKGEGLEHMQHSLRKAIAGELPISPPIARKLIRLFREQPESARSPTNIAADATVTAHLSSRETEVLGLIGGGLMIKQVAAQLGISYHTVNDNIKSIYRKLGIRTRAQAATEANKRSLVAP
jgi:DNA-binding NarL/FixJ family response regulator